MVVKWNLRESEGFPAESSIAADELAGLSSMMMKQVFAGVLRAFERSPGLAKGLGRSRDVAFEHISMDEGRMQTVATAAVAARIRVNLAVDV